MDKMRANPITSDLTATCARCGAPFHCGRDDDGPCWCAALPALPPRRYVGEAGCLCEACLRRALQDVAERPDGASP